MAPSSNPEPPPSPPPAQQQWRQQLREADVNDNNNAQMQEELLPLENGGPTRHPSAPSHELFDIPTTVDPSYIISLIRKLVPEDGRPIDGTQGPALSADRRSDMNDNGDVEMETQGNDLEQSPASAERPEKTAREEVCEESGCILWDLAANKEHALFMAQNLVLEVLLANLLTSESARITEISVGIIGNLACHEVVMKQITSTNRLLETIVQQLCSDDTPCLCEVFRLLTLGIQGCQSIVWGKELQSDNILSRVLWIAENTLNPTLIEKSVGLLLAIMENQQVAPILLPTLVKLGLPSLLVNLMAFEIGNLTGDRTPERYPALDSILRAIEALSVSDDFSEEICSKKEVTQMAVELIKFREKSEVFNSCVTAAVLIANVLADSPDLALELSKDLLLLQSLLDLFPFTSDDLEAKNALWSIIARFLVRIKEIQMSSFEFSQYVWTLVSRSDLIEDILLDGEFDRSSENNEMPTASDANLSSRMAAISCILNILYRWNVLKQELSAVHDPVLSIDDQDVQKLLDCCLKHAS